MVAVTALLVVGIGALSRLTATVTDTDDGLFRMSWRLQGIRIEECRTLSAEEIAALPAHMRRAEDCTGRFADYELEVRIDGAMALTDTIAPAGARRDRPLYVLRDLPLDAGSHEIEVSFDALVPDGTDPGALPLGYRWEGRVDLGEREIVLVTLSADASTLIRPEADSGR